MHRLCRCGVCGWLQWWRGTVQLPEGAGTCQTDRGQDEHRSPWRPRWHGDIRLQVSASLQPQGQTTLNDIQGNNKKLTKIYIFYPVGSTNYYLINKLLNSDGWLLMLICLHSYKLLIWLNNKKPSTTHIGLIPLTYDCCSVIWLLLFGKTEMSFESYNHILYKICSWKVISPQW